MRPIYLFPIVFVATVFFVTQILKRILKIELPKSNTQRDKDAELLDVEIKALKMEQEKLDSVSSFVEYSLLNRKVISLQKKKEALFKSEQLLRKATNPKIEVVLSTLKLIIENSLFLTLCAYFLLRNTHVPVFIKADLFWPVGNWLGFNSTDSGFDFAITFCFAALSVRFCNAIGSIFMED